MESCLRNYQNWAHQATWPIWRLVTVQCEGYLHGDDFLFRDTITSHWWCERENLAGFAYTIFTAAARCHTNAVRIESNWPFRAVQNQLHNQQTSSQPFSSFLSSRSGGQIWSFHICTERRYLSGSSTNSTYKLAEALLKPIDGMLEKFPPEIYSQILKEVRKPVPLMIVQKLMGTVTWSERSQATLRGVEETLRFNTP